MKANQPRAALGMQQAHFHREARRAIGVLGGCTPNESRQCLEALVQGSHPLLQAFAAARVKKGAE